MTPTAYPAQAMAGRQGPFGTRILLLIPHPDDEVVGCAAALARARARGARIFGLYLTHGRIPRAHAWPWARGKSYDTAVAKRLREGHKAAEFLGLDLVGDTAPTRAAREVWRDLSGVEADVRTAITACAPDTLWVPAFEGGNPDHDALNALATRCASLPVFEFSEYHFARGRAVSNAFIAPRGDETVLRLSTEERVMKRAALKLYKSEQGNLRGLTVEQEQFRPLQAYDYSVPPHHGQLWYTRFDWVPFRHPRVDFTAPEDVAQAITTYLAR